VILLFNISETNKGIYFILHSIYSSREEEEKDTEDDEEDDEILDVDDSQYEYKKKHLKGKIEIC